MIVLRKIGCNGQSCRCIVAIHRQAGLLRRSGFRTLYEPDTTILSKNFGFILLDRVPCNTISASYEEQPLEFQACIVSIRTISALAGFSSSGF